MMHGRGRLGGSGSNEGTLSPATNALEPVLDLKLTLVQRLGIFDGRRILFARSPRPDAACLVGVVQLGLGGRISSRKAASISGGTEVKRTENRELLPGTFATTLP
jgi:hypothetical protein